MRPPRKLDAFYRVFSFDLALGLRYAACHV
jgi:hypothetical protein